LIINYPVYGETLVTFFQDREDEIDISSKTYTTKPHSLWITVQNSELALVIPPAMIRLIINLIKDEMS